MKLLLLDGNSLAYRAFFALPEDLATPEGQPTNAVTGFVNMLLRMLREREPDLVAVAFDERTPAFRKDLYPEYKAQREEPPSSLSSQMGLIRHLCSVLRLPMFRTPEAEADDVIATLAARAAAEGVEVEIVTGDRDAFQCVQDPLVRVFYTMRGISEVKEMDEDAVEERYGVRPDRYVSLAALRGDNSDNLPGVPGIGDKTAAKLLGKYGSLEGIWEHVEELTPKQKENVKAAWDQVLVNRELMELHRDVPLEGAISDLQVGEWDLEEISQYFKSLAFRGPLERLGEIADRYVAEGAEPISDAFEPAVEIDARRLTDPAEIPGAVEALGPDLGLAVDFLRPGRKDPAWQRPVPEVWAVAAPDGRAVWFEHPLATPEVLSGLLCGGEPAFSTHGAKEIVFACAAAGVDVTALDIDNEIAAWVVDPGQQSFDLGHLTEKYLGVELESPDSEAGELTLDLGFDRGEQVARHAWANIALAPTLRTRLEGTGAWDLYADVERPLTRVLARMEAEGILVDTAYLDELSTDLTNRLDTLQDRIWQDAGHEFDINSVPQLREVLFDELGLTPGKKTKTGFSTDAATLEKLRDEHPIAEALLEYRNLEKLRSTYTDALPPLVDPADGRIHTRFNQTGAATGRLSSENPNLMNIPIRTEEGKRIRRAFVPEPGCLLCSADYSQIELRIMAHLSGDRGLIDAFAEDADIHAATAARVFGVPLSEVTPLMRSRAKVVNYGLLYGMQTFGLAQRMGLERDDAQDVIDTYFESFPSLHTFMDDLLARARDTAYTTTILGRRRTLRELRSSNYRVRQMGERMALNAPIQGSAADIMKVAMIRLAGLIDERALESRLLLQVHDELVLEVPVGEQDEVGALVAETMEGAADLAVPLVADVHFGESWAAAKD